MGSIFQLFFGLPLVSMMKPKFVLSSTTYPINYPYILYVDQSFVQNRNSTLPNPRRLGKRVFYCTNNSTKTRAEYLEKVSRLGFGGEEADIVATAHVAAKYLKAQGYDGKVFVLGSHAIAKELQNVGIEATGVGVRNALMSLTK